VLHLGFRIANAQHRRRLVIFDLQQPRRRSGLLRRLRHDDGHMLPVVQDAVVFEREARRGPERRHRRLGEFRGVVVRDDGQDTRRGLRLHGADPADPTGRDGRLHQYGVNLAGQDDIRRVVGGAGHLERPVEPVDRVAHDFTSDNSGHDGTPETVCRIRTMVRLASSTLNAVPATVNGS
jgi:hypothetical protein